jgi:xanthine dehydrogenase accessory factor
MIVLRGGGDLATGVAVRLFRSGLSLIITELPRPLAVRRLVAFSEAVYSETITVEDVTARRAANLEQALSILREGRLPVLVDPKAQVLEELREPSLGIERLVLIDGRMTKQPPDLGMEAASLVIGLGPGFVADENCHAVIETNRGHRLGRVIWHGSAQSDTGVPEGVRASGEVYRSERVLRAPNSGTFTALVETGDIVQAGQILAEMLTPQGTVIPLRAPFHGVVRGLLHSGLEVEPGFKIGDIDPRGEAANARLVSDKALAVGGGVLEAILSQADLRSHLWAHSPDEGQPSV